VPQNLHRIVPRVPILAYNAGALSGAESSPAGATASEFTMRNDVPRYTGESEGIAGKITMKFPSTAEGFEHLMLCSRHSGTARESMKSAGAKRTGLWRCFPPGF
jgi:hypothetical protein